MVFRIVFFWLPALVWMCLIYTASGDTQSAEHGSRYLGPLLQWLFPSLSPAGLEHAMLLCRKLGHLFEYFVLGLLAWRALGWRNQSRAWSWKRAFLAWGLAVLYAASDEFHQTFVPSRQGTPVDVLIDSCGAAAGLLLLFWLMRRRARTATATLGQPSKGACPPANG